MKTPWKIITVFVVAFALTGIAVSQQKPAAEKAMPEEKAAVKAEQHHHMLAAHHKNAIEHAKALHHHAATSKEINKAVAKEHTEEIGKSLEAAKKHHGWLEEHTREAKNLQMHHEAIRQHHVKATEHHQELKSEIEKPSPDGEKIKEHVAAVHHELSKAQAEHKAMKTKRRVGEPKAPLPKK